MYVCMYVCIHTYNTPTSMDGLRGRPDGQLSRAPTHKKR